MSSQPVRIDEAAYARLLDHRFGDGLVYLRDPGERALLGEAVQLGLVDRDGYLTSRGFGIWLAWANP